MKETLLRLRPIARDAEVLFYFYVVDEREILLGALSVRELLAAEDDDDAREASCRRPSGA